MHLSRDRYDEIDREVIKLFSNLTIRKFPYDCFDICKQLGIKVIPYSSVSRKKRKALKSISEDGCHILLETSEGVFRYIIYYNDKMPPHRVRFTIMHEIGHIVLDHTEHSDLAESEANHFAKYALAPPPLVHYLKIEDYMDLAEKFDLSQQCAFYLMRYYFKWLHYGPPDYLEYEITLISLFQPFLT